MLLERLFFSGKIISLFGRALAVAKIAPAVAFWPFGGAEAVFKIVDKIASLVFCKTDVRREMSHMPMSMWLWFKRMN